VGSDYVDPDLRWERRRPGRHSRTTAEAEALAGWVALHHRNLTTIYITHGHIDHFAGLSVLLQRFPNARAIATPKSVELMHKQTPRLSAFRKLWPG
jgi:glyoxylase-like metal-dependent hydrolase (beta-lactamase superfamily II)